MKSVWKFILFIVLPSPSVHADPMRFNFDSLFPSSPYKQVMISVAQIRSSVANLESYKSYEGDYDLFGDLVIGRLFNVNEHIDFMLAHKSGVNGDDLEYLLAIIDYMKQEMNGVFKLKASQKEHSIQKIINDMRVKLETAKITP